MKKTSPETTPNAAPPDLCRVKEFIYDPCNFGFNGLKMNPESAAYGACSFNLNGFSVQHRVAKITPKKTGQFTAIWKRNKNGTTEPYHLADNIDFLVITVRQGPDLGQFIFPQAVLAAQGIFSTHAQRGKLGFRVYPPWSLATNNQAAETQRWQTAFFLPVRPNPAADLNLARQLFTKAPNNGAG